MGDIIGSAGDFYRLRVIRIDDSEMPEMEWRDDILYRRPPADLPEEYDVWCVEAVDVDDDERVTVLSRLPSADDARAWLETAAEDLAVMTKSEFERTYFRTDAPPSGSDADVR
jgi:hypothetical protein